MRSLISFIFLAITLLQSQAFCISKYPKPRKIRTSVVIPCHYEHASLALEALEAYAAQTVLPDEVVISLSEVERVDPLTMSEFSSRNWPFKFILIPHSKAVSEGGNRNCACDRSTGNVLICSDADDLPHPQRVEIIKYFYENYNIDFLIHPFVHDENDWSSSPLIPKNINFIVPRELNQGRSMANGAVAIHRKVFKKVRWNEAFKKCVDADFNGTCYWYFPNRIQIDEPIYLYRSHLTSYR